jgi:hypothetical protein
MTHALAQKEPGRMHERAHGVVRSKRGERLNAIKDETQKNLTQMERLVCFFLSTASKISLQCRDKIAKDSAIFCFIFYY